MTTARILVASAICTFMMTASLAAQEITFRLHQFLPAQSTIPAKAIQPWADKIEAESGGRIAIQQYPSMQLGGAPAALLDQARDGVVDLVWTVLGYTPGRFPKSEVFELPFVVTTGEATSRAFYNWVQANAADEFADFKVIALHTHGPGLFHSSKPIESLEDLKGQKIRGGSRVINDMLNRLGAFPIGMPVPQVPEALSRGVIDGATIPWQVTTALKTSELVDNHTGFSGKHGLYTQTFILAMNKESYEALPDDLKAIIDANSGEDLSAMFGRVMDEDDVTAMKFAEERGNNIITLDEQETGRWRQAAQPAIDDWIADADEQGFDGKRLYESAVAAVGD